MICFEISPKFDGVPTTDILPVSQPDDIYGYETNITEFLLYQNLWYIADSNTLALRTRNDAIRFKKPSNFAISWSNQRF